MYDQVVKCQRAGLCLSEHFFYLYLYHICLLMLLKCIAIYGDSSIKSKKSVTTTRTLSGLQIAELGN